MSVEFGEFEGLAEFYRAINTISRELGKELRKAERDSAIPVAREAQNLASSRISGMSRRKTVDWTQMRIGVSQAAGGFVYFAPKQRGRKTIRRPNLVDLMRKKAMEPALTKNTAQVRASLERAVNNAMRRAGV